MATLLASFGVPVLVTVARLFGFLADRASGVKCFGAALVAHAFRTNFSTGPGGVLLALGLAAIFEASWLKRAHLALLRVAAAANEWKADYREAEACLQQVFALTRQMYGKTSIVHQDAAVRLGRLYLTVGVHAEAERMLQEVSRVQAGALEAAVAPAPKNAGSCSKAHPSSRASPKLVSQHRLRHAATLTDLAMAYEAGGKFDKAEEALLEAQKVWDEFGTTDLRCLENMARIARVSAAMGKGEMTIQLLEEVAGCQKKLLGKRNLRYAVTLSELAAILNKSGDYERADSLLEEARDIRLQKLGENHPDYAACLNNMAALYKARGAHQKAKEKYEQARCIWRKVVGERHPDYVVCLTNLAKLYMAMDLHDEAEAMFLETKESWRCLVGEHHPNYSISLGGLARLYKKMGLYDKAELLLHQVKELRLASVGSEHPSFKRTLHEINDLRDLREAFNDRDDND
eukprot:TRINITY_DN10567_c0_g1_i2.p1 TRINITY_DN10567_c0_g1~~TRINITY_DN10567_c0_g1_i2.p1  ORF type:complete len:484 (-),score=75.39 TRINITY_DN10567_c0_g1_i2:76-1455(-)